MLWLTYEARYNPDAPADTILDTFEWQALYCTIHKTSTLPSHTPSIKDCIFWIAKLGGFLCRKRDGFPGVKTIWQGLRRLHDIVTTQAYSSGSSSDMRVVLSTIKISTGVSFPLSLKLPKYTVFKARVAV